MSNHSRLAQLERGVAQLAGAPSLRAAWDEAAVRDAIALLAEDVGPAPGDLQPLQALAWLLAEDRERAGRTTRAEADAAATAPLPESPHEAVAPILSASSGQDEEQHEPSVPRPTGTPQLGEPEPELVAGWPYGGQPLAVSRRPDGRPMPSEAEIRERYLRRIVSSPF